MFTPYLDAYAARSITTYSAALPHPQTQFGLASCGLLSIRPIAEPASLKKMGPRGILLLLFGLLLLTGLPRPVAAQPDSTRQAILREKGLPPNHTPKKALWRALAVPGWGQFYNRQYLKIPFVYAGLGGFTAAIIQTNNRYRLLRHAALYKLALERGNDPNPAFQDEYDTIVADAGGEVSSRILRQERDKFRRLRDLSVIGLGLFYGLTVLDAYVSAHLLTFDVGEDLSMRVQPASQGISAALRLRF